MRIIVSSLILALLAACGGGGSGTTQNEVETGGSNPHQLVLSGYYQTRGLPRVDYSRVDSAPTYSDGTYVYVGVNQGSIPSLRSKGTRNGVKIREGTVLGKVSRQELQDYLNNPRLIRYNSGPIVRIIGDDASSIDVQRIRQAVQIVNTALPSSMRIAVSSSSPRSHRSFVDRTTTGEYRAAGASLGTIYVEVVRRSEYQRCSSCAGTSWVREGSSGIHHSYIQIPADTMNKVEHDLVTLLAHELMHAIGVDYHVSRQTGTIMWYGARGDIGTQPKSLLYPLDRAALQVMYSGTSAASFGPWAQTNQYLTGRTEHSRFGVVRKNGYVESWAYGRMPRRTLAASGIVGTATWSGALVGFTDEALVKGDAEIQVEVATLTGAANFTDMENWTRGDLHYMIAVEGNSLRETGGARGTLTGVFTGRNHEGVTGVLERDDLTAAFGATR